MAINIKKILGNGRTDIVGLDIGSSYVKAVQLEKDDSGFKLKAASAAKIRTKPDTPKPDRQDTLNAIHSCFEQAGIQTPNVVCSLGGPDLMVRKFTFPPMPGKMVDKAILLEAQQACPLDINNSTVDYQLTDTEIPTDDQAAPPPVRGFLAVATNEAIKNKNDIVTEALAKAVLMDIDGLALLNYVTGNEHYTPGDSIAVVNVGQTLTNIAILGNNGLPFIRDLPFAARAIIRKLALDKDLSENEIEKLLSQRNTGSPTTDISGSLKNTVQQLTSNITETLRYYSLQESSSPIAKIFLCGGFAMVDDFVDVIRNSFEQEIVVLNPFTKLRSSQNTVRLLPDNCGPAMVVATGLAMRSI